jgi:biopolymer transport protein ExbD
MIDIMMFLLVFFVMATLKMMAGTNLDIELPKASTADTLPERPVMIGVSNDGTATLDGAHMDRMGIAASLKRMVDSGEKLNVVIGGDRRVSSELLVDTMTLAQQAGVNRVSIAAQRK